MVEEEKRKWRRKKDRYADWYVNPWEEHDRKYGLNTEDLKGILSNLENLEANVGNVPSYFQNISKEDLMDPNTWPTEMISDPNPPVDLGGIHSSQRMIKNPDYLKIPANQAYMEDEIISNTLNEGEYLDWVGKEFTGWENEEWKKNFMNRTFPSPNNPYQLGTDPSDPFYREKSFSPHPQTFEIQDVVETPVLQYLAAQGNPELDLDNPNQKFFPKKGYPEVPLQNLRDYIASGAGVREEVGTNAAGTHWGYDPVAGMFDPTDEEKKSWYDIGVLPKYYDQPNTLANIMGHETGHLAVTSSPNFWQDAPYPWAYLKEGKTYDVMKNIYPDIGEPSKHFSSAHRFHPAFHNIDEMFFGGYNQPKTAIDRVNPVNKEQAENAMYIINRTMQDERNSQKQWDTLGDPVAEPATGRPTHHFSTGGLVSLVL